MRMVGYQRTLLSGKLHNLHNLVVGIDLTQEKTNKNRLGETWPKPQVTILYFFYIRS